MKQNNIFTLDYWHKFDYPIDKIIVSFGDSKSNITNLTLTVRNNFGIRIAELAGEPIIQYNDIQHSIRLDKFEFQATLMTSLKQNNIDLLYLHNVRQDSHLSDLLKDIGFVSAEKKAPFIDVSAYKNIEDFLKSLSAKTRKSRRRSIKKIEAAFDVRFETLIAEQITIETVTQIINLKISQLNHLGLSSRLFVDQQKIDALKTIILTPNDLFNCVLSVLKCDDKLVAAEIGYLHEGIYYSFLGAMDHGYQAYSPGGYQLLKTINWAIDNDVKTFDLLAPEDVYKFSWTANKFVHVDDIIVSMNIKGRFYSQIYLKYIRATLKKLYFAVKNKIRKI